jgi:hypothetical protein
MQKFFEVIRQLEKERRSRIWCIFHRNVGHICGPTIWAIHNERENIGTGDKVEILLHSGGGHPEIAYTAMKFFRRRFRHVNVIVPLYAKSSATLMCLGADKIYMGEMADLGPIDIQIDDDVEHGSKGFSPLDEFKSLEFMREQAIEWMDYYAAVMNVKYGMSIKEALKDSVPLVSSLMQPIFAQIDPVEMGGYRRAIAIGEEYAKRMLSLTDNENTPKIIRRLVWGYPSHDFCIDFEEAEALELPVERLPASQDLKLSAAILDVDNHHGFAPAPPAPTRHAAPRKSVRKAAGTAPVVATKRVNGSNGARAEERVRA